MPLILLGHQLTRAGACEPVSLEMPERIRHGESKVVLALHLRLDGSRLRLLDPTTADFCAPTKTKDGIIEDRDRAIAEERRRLRTEDRETNQLKRRLANRTLVVT